MSSSTNGNDRNSHAPNHHLSITASDDTSYNPPFAAIYAAGAGTLVIEDLYGVQATYTVPAGYLLVMRGKRVMAASSATGLVAQF